MNTEERAGSFTVFFSLLCLPMILLWVSLLQWTRFMVERNDALRMTQEAGQSILSCYSEELTRRYGLYGTEGSQIESRWEKFIEKNQRVSWAEIQQRPGFGCWFQDHGQGYLRTRWKKSVFRDSKHCRIWIFLELR